jgi:hypothetical protein
MGWMAIDDRAEIWFTRMPVLGVEPAALVLGLTPHCDRIWMASQSLRDDIGGRCHGVLHGQDVGLDMDLDWLEERDFAWGVEVKPPGLLSHLPQPV